LVAIGVAADAVGAVAARAVSVSGAGRAQHRLALVIRVARLIGGAAVVGGARGDVGTGAQLAGNVAGPAGPVARRRGRRATNPVDAVAGLTVGGGRRRAAGAVRPLGPVGDVFPDLLRS